MWSNDVEVAESVLVHAVCERNGKMIDFNCLHIECRRLIGERKQVNQIATNRTSEIHTTALVPSFWMYAFYDCCFLWSIKHLIHFRAKDEWIWRKRRMNDSARSWWTRLVWWLFALSKWSATITWRERSIFVWINDQSRNAPLVPPNSLHTLQWLSIRVRSITKLRNSSHSVALSPSIYHHIIKTQNTEDAFWQTLCLYSKLQDLQFI